MDGGQGGGKKKTEQMEKHEYHIRFGDLKKSEEGQKKETKRDKVNYDHSLCLPISKVLLFNYMSIYVNTKTSNTKLCLFKSIRKDSNKQQLKKSN